jgi:hypothetical protein
MSDLLQRPSSVQPLVDRVSEVHANDLEHVHRVHYWIAVCPFAGSYFPICFCRNVGPGMVSRAAALSLVCEVEEAEVASEARRALLHG